MSAPPIPSFEPYSCPNCGLPLRELVEFCPACGARTEKAQRKPQWLNYLMIVGLVLLMVPLGLAGACFLMFAPAGGFGGIRGSANHPWDIIGTGTIGLVLVAAAVLCGICIAKLRSSVPVGLMGTCFFAFGVLGICSGGNPWAGLLLILGAGVVLWAASKL